MPDAARTAARALAQLDRLGTTYTLTRASSTPDSDEPWKVTMTVATHAVTGALLDFSAAERARLAIGATDRQYLIAAHGLAIVPQPGDILTDGDAELSVVAVQTVRSGATDVVYYLHVRR